MNVPIDRRTRPQGARFFSWKAPDGWDMRRMHWPQPEENAVRGSLIFAGGRGDFIEKYLEPLGHWHKQGWDVSSFDWRGQGDSRGTIVGGHLDSFDPLVADVAALVAEWIAEGPGPHVLIGHSMGGHLSLRLIAEHEPKLAAAVLVAPMIGINGRPVPSAVGRAYARLMCRLGLGERRAWKANEKPTLPGVGRQHFLTNCPDRYADEMWWKEVQKGFDLGPPSWGWLDAAFASIAKLTPERLRAVRLPILLLGTERDRLVSPRAIRAAAGLLPRVELLMFERAAHELLREEDRVRLAALERIDAFLDQHAPR